MELPGYSHNVRSLASINQRIMPVNKNNLFLEMHKLNYEKKRLIKKVKKMDMEHSLIMERLDTLQHMLGHLMNELEKEEQYTGRSGGSKKLKY